MSQTLNIDMNNTQSTVHMHIEAVVSDLLNNIITLIARDQEPVKAPYMSLIDLNLPAQGPITGVMSPESMEETAQSIKRFLVRKNRCYVSSIGQRPKFKQAFPSKIAPTEETLDSLQGSDLLSVISEQMRKQEYAKVGTRFGAKEDRKIRVCRRMRMQPVEFFSGDLDLEGMIHASVDDAVVRSAFSGVRQTTPPWFIDDGPWDVLYYEKGGKFEPHRDRRGNFDPRAMERKSTGLVAGPSTTQNPFSVLGSSPETKRVYRGRGKTDSWVDGSLHPVVDYPKSSPLAGTGAYTTFGETKDRHHSSETVEINLRYEPYTCLICLDSNIPRYSDQGSTEIYLPGDAAHSWNKIDECIPQRDTRSDDWDLSHGVRSYSHRKFMMRRILGKRLIRHVYNESTIPGKLLIFPSQCVHASREIRTAGLYKLVLKFKIWIDVGAWLGSKDVTSRKFGQKFWSLIPKGMGGKEYLGHLLNNFQYRNVAFVPNKYIHHDKNPTTGLRPRYFFDLEAQEKIRKSMRDESDF